MMHHLYYSRMLFDGALVPYSPLWSFLAKMVKSKYVYAE